MHLDPLLPVLALGGLVVLALGLVVRRLGQPAMIGHLLAGLLLGPQVGALVEDEHTLSVLGGLGVVLLLFFVGMELDPRRLLASWRVALFGTALQVLASLACTWALGAVLSWSWHRVVLLGFVISLSSTAVVLPLMKRRGDGGALAERVTAILLAQDVAIVPMLVVVGLMAGRSPSPGALALQAVGALGALGFALWMARRGEVRLGIGRLVGDDPEMQVFAALILALGLALVTGLFRLSTALGALLAGMLVSTARETRWVHGALEPFRVVFVALFFASIGMLLDLAFLRAHAGLVAGLTGLALVTNTLINGWILRLFGSPWREGLYGGALMAQVGEFGFVLVTLGRSVGAVTDFAFDVVVASITLSFLASAPWAALVARLTGRAPVLARADAAR